MELAHLTLLGASGSGKSSFALMMALHARRVVVLDTSADPLWSRCGVQRSDVETCVRWILDNPAQPYHLVCRPESEAGALVIAEAVYESQRLGAADPILVVMEEATVFSGPRSGMPEAVEAIVTRGRREGITLLSVAQEETQLATSIRRQAFVVVSMRQRSGAIPSSTAETFGREVDRLPHLETVTPHTRPVYGVHYLTRPAQVDPIRHVVHAMSQTPPEPLPDTWEPPTG